MHILLSHPTGNANLRALLEAMEKGSTLAEFCTTLAVDPTSKLLRCLPASIRMELLRRSYPVAHHVIQSFPSKEVMRLIFTKVGLNTFIADEASPYSVDAVYANFDAKVAARLEQIHTKKKLSAIYAYEDGALQSFKKAQKLGLKKLYDLPIGYWKAARTLLQSEMDKRPDWAQTITGFKDSTIKLQKKDDELQLADHIFVASSFTRKTLESYDGKLAKIAVIPYGFPPTFESREYEALKNRKLKLLFVGGLSQRKGLADVFEAVSQLDDEVSLTVIGRKTVENCEPLNEGLKNHRYIQSLPHSSVLVEMRQHDILIFPSLFEGFGLVVTEAMSQGTPVITTARTCGPDLIEHGKNGWLVEPANAEQLCMQIKKITQTPECVEVNGRNALNTARQRPWSQYGKEMMAQLKSLMN